MTLFVDRKLVTDHLKKLFSENVENLNKDKEKSSIVF